MEPVANFPGHTHKTHQSFPETINTVKHNFKYGLDILSKIVDINNPPFTIPLN